MILKIKRSVKDGNVFKDEEKFIDGVKSTRQFVDKDSGKPVVELQLRKEYDDGYNPHRIYVENDMTMYLLSDFGKTIDRLWGISMSNIRNIPIGELRDICQNSSSYVEVMRKIGYKKLCGNINKYVRDYIESVGIDSSNLISKYGENTLDG